MEDGVTKEDLRQFGMLLIGTIQKMIEGTKPVSEDLVEAEWLKARVVRKMLDISPGSLQNLRITGKVRFKKFLVRTTTTRMILCNCLLMEMKMIKALNLNNDLQAIEKDTRLKVWHIALLVALFIVASKQGRREHVKVSRSRIMALSHINTLPTYHKYFKELQELGYIIYVHPIIQGYVAK